ARSTDSLELKHLGHTQVCRSGSAAMAECGPPVGTVGAPQNLGQPGATTQQTYVDTLTATSLSSNPEAEIYYAVSVLNGNERSAGLSNVVAVPEVTAPEAPGDFDVSITADGVAMKWRAVAESPGKHFYRIYRRAEGTTTDTVAGEAPWGSERLVDHSFEWEKTYLYRATVVTELVINGKNVEFESDDSPAVKVFAHDVFPPAVPSGLQAAFSGPGQKSFIDLIWAPDTDADLAGYNVYRNEGGKEVKINEGLVKTPAFRDNQVASGHRYIYLVTAVDIRGNESAKSEEASESVP
ncbi:MAG TPA: hypothetical protein VL981_12165, partial [Candidatus Methylacidiphilales bacterium]|nr:hypothetical protein [Candidatus Methylacidiphilales bacterium]